MVYQIYLILPILVLAEKLYYLFIFGINVGFISLKRMMKSYFRNACLPKTKIKSVKKPSLI